MGCGNTQHSTLNSLHWQPSHGKWGAESHVGEWAHQWRDFTLPGSTCEDMICTHSFISSFMHSCTPPQMHQINSSGDTHTCTLLFAAQTPHHLWPPVSSSILSKTKTDGNQTKPKSMGELDRLACFKAFTPTPDDGCHVRKKLSK